MGRGNRVTGQVVVYAKGAADHKQPLRDVMGGVQGEFFGPAVHIQGAHFQVETFGFVRPHAPLDGGRLPKTDDVRLGRSPRDRTEISQHDEDAHRATHGPRLSTLGHKEQGYATQSALACSPFGNQLRTASAKPRQIRYNWKIKAPL